MTIYIPCPEVAVPAGGVQKLYDHVDVLNRHGLDAAIVHRRRAFRAGWFSNQTRIAYEPVSLRPGDLLAVPEVYGDALASMVPGVPRVSVNQNAYNTFRRVADPDRHPYAVSHDLLRVMVVSEDNFQLVSRLFPQLEVRRVHYGLDPAVFYCPPGPRGRVLGYMPRKRASEIEVVLRSAALELQGWEAQRIDGLAQAEMAATLRRSALFLSFSQREGCPMPPLEALACGCHVIGFDGFGGREYFDPRFTTRIEDGDLLAFGDALAGWLRAFEWTPVSEVRAAEASSYVLERYSLEREEKDVLAFYAEVTSGAEARWEHAGRSAVLRIPPLGPPRWRRAARRGARMLSQGRV